MTLVHHLFSFKGRMRRRDWWLFSLGLFAIEKAIVKAIELVLDGPSYDLLRGNFFSWLLADAANLKIFLVHAVVMTALTWPNLALTAKRAHDCNAEGYWLIGVMLAFYAIFFVPPELFEQAGRAFDTGDLIGSLPLLVPIVLGIAAVITVVVLGFVDGTRGPNRFGPSPKGIDAVQDTAGVFE